VPQFLFHASNLIWLIASVAAFAFIVPRVPSRRGRAAVIVACAVALLFPIISISDDFAEDRSSLEQLLATVVFALIAFALIAVARIASPSPFLPALAPVTKCDPRSPPRR
jgi:hypothetical protein